MKLYLITIAVSILILITAMGFHLWPEEKFEPLYGPGFSTPQEVMKVEVHAGEMLYVTGVVKCNRLDYPITVTVSSQWRRIDNGGQIVVGDLAEAGGTLNPGCYHPKDFEHQLPTELEPGLWVYEGVNTTYRGADIQAKFWTTEPFRVVP